MVREQARGCVGSERRRTRRRAAPAPTDVFRTQRDCRRHRTRAREPITERDREPVKSVSVCKQNAHKTLFYSGASRYTQCSGGGYPVVYARFVHWMIDGSLFRNKTMGMSDRKKKKKRLEIPNLFYDKKRFDGCRTLLFLHIGVRHEMCTNVPQF